MIRTLTLATALAAAIALPAIAEDVKAPVAATSAASAQSAQSAAGLSLTSKEAEAWIGKPVYSSDGMKGRSRPFNVPLTTRLRRCMPISAASWAWASIG